VIVGNVEGNVGLPHAWAINVLRRDTISAGEVIVVMLPSIAHAVPE